MLLFKKENWGRAYWSGSDLNEFLDMTADDSSGALLAGARKIDESASTTGVSNSVHIRETTVSDTVVGSRLMSSPHNNEPPENDFMYQSMTSSTAAERVLAAVTQNAPVWDINDLDSKLSVTSL